MDVGMRESDGGRYRERDEETMLGREGSREGVIGRERHGGI